MNNKNMQIWKDLDRKQQDSVFQFSILSIGVLIIFIAAIKIFKDIN